MDAGLPNITGTFHNNGLKGGSNSDVSGAFYFDSGSGRFNSYGTGAGERPGFGIDASRSSAIYGKSITVQPEALTCRYYIKF